jgi:hypothetical protein
MYICSGPLAKSAIWPIDRAVGQKSHLASELDCRPNAPETCMEGEALEKMEGDLTNSYFTSQVVKIF